jgi:hypothetical protein
MGATTHGMSAHRMSAAGATCRRVSAATVTTGFAGRKRAGG